MSVDSSVEFVYMLFHSEIRQGKRIRIPSCQ